MDPVVNYALRVKLHKLHHNAVFIQALLSEILNKSGKKTFLVKGYCTVNSDSCFHIWIEDDMGATIDVTRHIFPEFNVTDFKLSKDKIKGAQEDQFTVDLFELYEKDKREFWKKASIQFLNFRSKCHAKKK